MKISVIIPVYNGEKTIKRCIDSVLGQTLSDIEIIVVNDGSTDGTLGILNSFADERMKVITQENSGQGFARNTGMDAASGEYIGFVDADDTIEPEMYEKMYALAKEYDAQIVQCNLTDIYPGGRTKIQLSKFSGIVEITDSADYISCYLARCRHSYEVCNKIFERDFIVKNNLRMQDTRKYFAEDILFNMEAVKHLTRAAFINEPYYNYYQHPESHMHSGAEARLEKMQIMFDDCLSRERGEMYNATSFLAAILTIYNIAKCSETEKIAAALKKVNGYIKSGLKAKCGIKRGPYLAVFLCSPVKLKIRLAKLLDKDSGLS